MILETGNLDSVPILLVRALAGDAEEWTIELHLRNGTVRAGILQEADWNWVRLQDESGDEPWGELHSWGEVERVFVP